MSEPDCWCEYVDIGVGMQKVAENPECLSCFPDGPECNVLPNGQGPACDWDPECPVHGRPGSARCELLPNGHPSCGLSRMCPDECYRDADEFPLCTECGRPSKDGHYHRCSQAVRDV